MRNSTTQPAFSFAYTDPKKDVDVSAHMDLSGIVEAGITSIFQKIFVDRCKPAHPGAQRALFADVGGNFGWFSMVAAAMGCRCVTRTLRPPPRCAPPGRPLRSRAAVTSCARRVIAFEPVPTFHAFFEYSVHLNGFASLVDIRGNVVSHMSGTTLKMVGRVAGPRGVGGHQAPGMRLALGCAAQCAQQHRSRRAWLCMRRCASGGAQPRHLGHGRH